MGLRQACLFCDNPANSKEDVLPVWIQEKVKGKQPIVVNGFSGERPIVMQGMKPNIKTACVCGDCNGGWMSRLEGRARKILGPLMEDIHLFLDKDQQITIAKWAVKPAMTAESFNRKTRKLFYTRDECSRFRESWTFPPHTLVCLGRYAGTFDLGIVGVDVWDEKPEHPEVTHSYVTTVAFKRVVIQVVSVHARREFEGGIINLRHIPGPWRQSLLELCPLETCFGRHPLRLSITESFPWKGSPIDSVSAEVR